MPIVDVVDLNNKKVGELELADSVFAAPVNQALLYQAVHHYLACQRRGTAKTKTRGEVRGGGRKPWRQKGTGRARHGSIRSPLWVHGGTVHGPVPRSYAYHLPRKMIQGALRSALSAKLQDGELKVVREFDLPDHKTKTMVAVLKRLETNKTVLVVDNSQNRNLELATRNIPGVKLVATKDLTTYDVLRHKHLLLSEQAARKLSEALAP